MNKKWEVMQAGRRLIIQHYVSREVLPCAYGIEGAAWFRAAELCLSPVCEVYYWYMEDQHRRSIESWMIDRFRYDDEAGFDEPAWRDSVGYESLLAACIRIVMFDPADPVREEAVRHFAQMRQTIFTRLADGCKEEK